MDDPALASLKNHRFFGRLIEVLEAHPYRNELAALHSSLIVRGGNILSIGYNKPTANGFARAYAYHKGFTVHSELDCIQKVRRKIDLSGCVMYNARLTKKNQIEISKPCVACQELLLNYSFKKVIYTTPSGIQTFRMSECELEAA